VALGDPAGMGVTWHEWKRSKREKWGTTQGSQNKAEKVPFSSEPGRVRVGREIGGRDNGRGGTDTEREGRGIKADSTSSTPQNKVKPTRKGAGEWRGKERRR